MDRDEFMELVYETFADEPDNVLANGIIEAADAYVEYEKAQLSQEGTTSDLISRQAAIDAFNKQIQQCRKALGSLSLSDVDKHAVEVKMASLRAYRGMLENLPTIEPEPQWIPVSERLPEVHESGNFVSGIYMQSNPVLVYGTCEYEDNAQFHVVTYCDDLDGNTYWSTELDAITVSGVLAWMPLPEPYKPNNE